MLIFCRLCGVLYELDGMTSRTIDGRYKCKYCKTTYKHKGNLWRHLKEECGLEPSHQCQFCRYQCKRKDNMRKHLMLVHKVI